jgi:hypothetical protein
VLKKRALVLGADPALKDEDGDDALTLAEIELSARPT